MKRVRAARGRPTLSTKAVGVIGVIVFLAAVYAGFTKKVPFVEGYRVTAVVQSSNQLRGGSPVRIAGVDVGKVVGLEHGPGTTALVTLELADRARPIHTDAEIRIRPRLFLEGGFYVDMRPGSPSAPELEDGGTIPLGQTAIPVQFDQVLTSALPRPARDSFTRILDELGTAFDDGGAQQLGLAQKMAIPALRDIAIVGEAARGERTHDVSNTVRSTARITRTLAANDAALGDLVTGMARTTAALAAEQGSLRASIRGLDDVLRETPAALTAIDRGLPPVKGLARDLRPGLRIAPPVLRGAVGLVDQLELATRPAELPRLVSRLDAPIRTLPQLSQRLTTLFPLVDPVTDCVRDRALPVLNAKLDDGRLSTGREVWKELASGTVGLNSAAQNFDANGGVVRYLFALGEGSLNLGLIPGLGNIFAAADEPIAGVRPQWPGKAAKPPFRPDAPCREQAAPNLDADSAPSVARFRKGGVRKGGVMNRTEATRALTRAAKDGR